MTGKCKDRLVRTWLKSMLLTDIDQVSKSLYQLSREITSHFEEDDFFLLFNQGYLRLNFSLTRLSLLRIRTYLNYFIFYQRDSPGERADFHEEFIEVLDKDNNQVIFDNIELKSKDYMQKVERLIAFCIKNRKMAMNKEEEKKQEEDRKNGRGINSEEEEEEEDNDNNEEGEKEKGVQNKEAKQKSIIQIFDEKYDQIQKKDGFDRQYLVTKILTYE